jgi:hypothetical protein
LEGLRCAACGKKGDGVRLHNAYIGGKGVVCQPECDDRRACWGRIDAKEPKPKFRSSTKRGVRGG